MGHNEMLIRIEQVAELLKQTKTVGGAHYIYIYICCIKQFDSADSDSVNHETKESNA